MMKGPVPKTVDEYLLYVPDAHRAALQRVRKAIQEAAPEAQEGISYQMPGYKYKGALVYFASFRDHCSFFPGSKKLIVDFAKELEGFTIFGATVHFTPQKQIPIALIKKMVKVRVAENEARFETKKAKSKGERAKSKVK